MSIYAHERPCDCDDCIDRHADEAAIEEYDERMAEAAREE